MNALGTASAGLLGDTPQRDYAQKLQRFNAFAEPELRQAMGTLRIEPGASILDAGCGTGEALCWLAEAAGAHCKLTGIDLSTAHIAIAGARAPGHALVLQGDVTSLPAEISGLDLIWCVNTINHLRDPVNGIQALARRLRAGGQIALGQSSLLPDMYFAWDARLERVTNEAVRQYYRERYELTEESLTGVRSLVAWLQRARLHRIVARTFVIERLQPLSLADRGYLLDTIFRGTWGERLRPYLAASDYEELQSLCDPRSTRFALHRPDFHFLQTFTLAVGEA